MDSLFHYTSIILDICFLEKSQQKISDDLLLAEPLFL